VSELGSAPYDPGNFDHERNFVKTLAAALAATAGPLHASPEELLFIRALSITYGSTVPSPF
jgi:hypothetical protein